MTSSTPAPLAWDSLRGELYAFVARRIPAADAEDVVQEALLRIHRGLANVRAQGAVVGWMYQVTRNALVDHLRATRTGEELEDDKLVEPIDPDDTAFRRMAACVAPFVAMLPAHYREALDLVELRGMSQVDAAAQLGVPISTMKSRVQRGRAELRQLLEQCCAVELDPRGHVIDITPRPRCLCTPSHAP